jgi:hypothetical protein
LLVEAAGEIESAKEDDMSFLEQAELRTNHEDGLPRITGISSHQYYRNPS